MILGICANADVLKVMRIIRIIIEFIRIVVPIILIIVPMIDFTRSITDGKLDESLKSLKNKIITAVIIFLLPTVVTLIFKTIDVNRDYYDCIANATSEGIRNAQNYETKTLVEQAIKTKNLTDYNMAVYSVNKLKDETTKKELIAQLDSIKQEVIIRSKIDELNTYYKKDLQEEIEKEIDALDDEKLKEELKAKVITTKASKTKYTKEQIIATSEDTVRAMSNEEFMQFIGSAAVLVYNEKGGGVLPSITIGQACLESGYGNSFTSTTYNVYGLIGYPGSKPKVGVLRKFDNFYEATQYHASYFTNYSNVYGNFLECCKKFDVDDATPYLKAYANGSTTYGSKVQSIINSYGLKEYDELVK